jgi:hypothetical protein
MTMPFAAADDLASTHVKPASRCVGLVGCVAVGALGSAARDHGSVDE